MKRALVLALATLLPTSAFAYKHIFSVWSPEDMPIGYYVADGELCQVGIPEGYCTEAAMLGFEAWEAAPCADYTHEYLGPGDGRGWANDGEYHISFNDPFEDIEETATLAATLTIPTNQIAFVQDGENYFYIDGSDIMFNDNTLFDTHTNIEAGQCNGGTNMLETMTHEIGHSLGLGHSCDDGDICTDPKLLEAVMYWTGGPCTSSSQTIKQDDIEGFTALYGPFATFDCSHELDPDDRDTIATGNVPFTLRCVVESDVLEEVNTATWSWGDGGSSEGVRVEHEYTEPGNYNVRLEVNGEREECGPEGWNYSFRRVGYVRACGVPEAAFEVEQDEGLRYTLFNDTDLSVFGCVFNIEWQVFRGEGTGGEQILTLNSWEPTIEFPEPGTYTIVQNVGGPAGTGASITTIEATRGGGCSVAPTGALGLFALLPLAFMRRRQS